MSGWPSRVILREAAANLVSAPTRLIFLVAVIASLAATVMWLELAAVGEAQALEAGFTDAGGYVAVVGANRGVDAGTCDTLNSHPSVVAAGGYRPLAPVQTGVSPGLPFQHVAATVGLVGVWDPGARLTPAALIVGSAAADELGLRNDSWLTLDGEGSAPVSVFEPTDRNSFASRAILDLVAPTGLLSECWVELRRPTFSASVEMLTAMFARDEASVHRAQGRGAFAADPADVLADRLTQHAWLPAALAAVCALVLVSTTRRPEFAIYRAFDLSRAGIVAMLQLETLLLATAAVALGAGWAIATYAATTAVPTVDQVAIALRSGLLFLTSVCVVAPPIATMTAAGPPASLLKER